MHTTSLRKVGGSVMMVVPPDLLEAMSVRAGSKVGMTVESGNLVVAPVKPKFTLEELLAQCDLEAPFPAEDRAWQEMAPVGRELF